MPTTHSTTDDAPTPCVIYAAKSTEDNRGSIPTQLRDGHALAEREDWEVIGEFKDEGFSAYSGNRGHGLVRAKEAATAAAAERGECMLVVQHSDRLSRGAGDAPGAADHLGELFFQLRRQGVTIYSERGGELTDPIRAVVEGERNTEDSQRKSQAVSKAKDRQMERGERLGGPVPDGLVLAIERDEGDRIVSRRYVRDPERAPIIERMVDLSEEGHGDGEIARTLNREGHRTRKGRPWNRRRVQATLLNPIYGGRVQRATQGGKRLAEPEVVEATNVEALIPPDRWDHITAKRSVRDLGRGKHARGGRPTTQYVLAKLGICDRCGERLYASTSPYRRKADGGRRRTYVCAHYKNSTGLCDQPPLDAEAIDAAVVDYLDRLFVDFDAWIEEVGDARDSKHRVLQDRLDNAEREAEQARRGEERTQRRYLALMDEGDEQGAIGVEGALALRRTEREVADRQVRALNAELARAADPLPADAMLDAYGELRDAVRTGGDGAREVNERLRAKFSEFRIDRVSAEVVGIQPVLRADAVDFDWRAALAAWEEAGEPEPAPEQVKEYDRLGDASDPIWVRPRAKALTVATPATKGRNSQE